VTTGTLEKMHREVLPHSAYSSDLAPSDFHLFDPLRGILGGKTFRADDEVKLAQRWLEEQPKTLFERGIMKVPEEWQRCTEQQGDCVEKLDITFFQKVVINKCYNKLPVYI
jgi:histone-lysine N-methyltransferase SETMAR